MADMDIMKIILEESEDGVITAEQVTAAGLHRSILQKLVEEGVLYRFGRGLYVKSETWEDRHYLLQRKYGRGIYSCESALYLLGYTGQAPKQDVMTFPKGYNAPSLKRESIIIRRVVPENYSVGVLEIQSPVGNPIQVYNVERTLCDLLRGNGNDLKAVNAAMKRYVVSEERNTDRLLRYAQQLRVKPKVERYLDVLL